ncbi:MAG: hypothetical protein KHW87_04090 [Clostridiales bacterium]|nr:hypothetical protein [Clostridiales bacterium]
MKSERLDMARWTDAEADGTEERTEEEMMSDTTLNRLIDYLKNVEHWPTEKIVSLLEYISKSNKQ